MNPTKTDNSSGGGDNGTKMNDNSNFTSTFASSASVSRESLANRAVGYLVVEDCEVYVPIDVFAGNGSTTGTTNNNSNNSNTVQEQTQQQQRAVHSVEFPSLSHERGVRNTHRSYFQSPFRHGGDDQKPHQVQQKAAAVEQISSGRPCHHCHLVLEKKMPDVAETNMNSNDSDGEGSQDGGHQQMKTEPHVSGKNVKQKRRMAPTLTFSADRTGPRFDGTINDTKSNNVRCQCKNKKRSDAVLLVGTAISAHDVGHIHVESIQVWFPPSASTSAATMCSTEKLVKVRAAGVLVTFSVHEILRQPPKTVASLLTEKAAAENRQTSLQKKRRPNSSNQPVIVDGPKRRFLTNSNKMLPPSTQLVLTMMSCDWDRLNEKISRWTKVVDGSTNGSSSQPSGSISNHLVNSSKKKMNLFPDDLTLASVYRRIGTASYSSGYVLDGSIVRAASNPSSSSTGGVGSRSSGGGGGTAMSLSRLPPDVLCHHIGPFLKARTVDSLRCTCKRLHHTMRAVVPGLKLKLFSHQIRSLYWTRMREAQSITERDLLVGTTALSSLKNENNDGDLHRAATGGATVALCPRPRKTEDSFIIRQPVVRMSQMTGDEIIVDVQDPLSRTLSRGGLLCDDPGLGKTVTVLSLILQTMGLSTAETFEKPLDNLSDQQIFAEYWKEQFVPEFRQQDLTKLFQSFLKSSVEVYYFFDEPEKPAGSKIDYLHGVSNPICLKDIKTRVASGFYNDSASFAVFESDVLRVFQNAIENCKPTDIWYLAAKRMTYNFKELVRDFKENKARIAKKSFSSPTAKPKSSVAALVEKTNKAELFKSLIVSRSTLLVVPSVLLDHWLEQIGLHVDPKYCIDRPWQKPITFIYNGSADQRRRMKEVFDQIQDQTHFPYVFVDKAGSKALPSPEFLALFRIVITTNLRFSTEWKNGSFEAELKRKGSSTSERREAAFDENDYFRARQHLVQSEEACPLLKINWLRMVVDEGHSMSKGQNAAILFASWVNAERRWATTGTPTPENRNQNGLSNLLHLTEYLQHDFFSPLKSGDASWNTLVARPWHRGCLSSFFRVQSLLSLLMVRHTKEDILELPQPKRSTKIVAMSPEEVTAYNTLVCAVQSNLLITSMKGAKTSGKQDSLLHKSQREHAREAMRNIRLVCVGGTQVRPTLSDKNYRDSLTDFHACNKDVKARKDFTEFLSRTTSGKLSQCDCCQVMLSLLLVCPCGHFVCYECMDSSTKSCTVCEKEFDVDQFQRLQPGFEFQWIQNIDREGGRNPPAVDNEGGANPPANPGGNFPMNAFGMGGFPHHRTQNDVHQCVYDPSRANGVCTLCRKEHDECYLVKTRTCPTCHRTAKDCPSYETKSHYLIEKMLELHELQEEARKPGKTFAVLKEYEGLGTKRPVKAIIFSQFRQQLNVVGDRLIRRFGPGCVAEFWGVHRRQELHKFTSDPNCFLLLLSTDGSEGLDLSFVTHIWFLESLWDRSLQSQVEGRAWRMGASESVSVETLLAKSSIEEMMESYEKIDVQQSFGMSQGNLTSMHSQNRINYLLESLQLVTNSATLGFGTGAASASAAAANGEDTADFSPAIKRQRREGQQQSNSVRFEEDFEVDVNRN